MGFFQPKCFWLGFPFGKNGGITLLPHVHSAAKINMARTVLVPKKTESQSGCFVCEHAGFFIVAAHTKQGFCDLI